MRALRQVNPQLLVVHHDALEPYRLELAPSAPSLRDFAGLASCRHCLSASGDGLEHI